MVVDETRHPILIINLDEVETLGVILDRMRLTFKRGERICVVFDGTRGMKLSLAAAERKVAAAFLRDEAAQMQKYWAGLCTASTSPLVRGVITAVQWISPLPIPGHVCATRQQGLDWAAQRLAQKAA